MKILTKESIEALIELMHSGEPFNAVIVVKSKRTGKDVTYKLSKAESKPIKVGYEDGYNNFAFSHWTSSGNIRAFVGYEKQTGKVTLGGKWLLLELYSKSVDKIMAQAELYHTGRCLKCNRILTDLESVELGFGPICRS